MGEVGKATSPFLVPLTVCTQSLPAVARRAAGRGCKISRELFPGGKIAASYDESVSTGPIKNSSMHRRAKRLFLGEFLQVYRSVCLQRGIPGVQRARAALETSSLAATATFVGVETHGSGVQRVSFSHLRASPEDIEALLCTLHTIGVTPDCLQLNANQCGARGTYAVSSALRTTSLSNTLVLELFENNVGDDGAVALAELLGCPHAILETLKIGDNNITEKGAAALAHALTTNRSLRALHIGGNPIGEQGLVSIVAALEERSAPLAAVGCRDIVSGSRFPAIAPRLWARLCCAVGDVQIRANGILSEDFVACCGAMRMEIPVLHTLEVAENPLTAQSVRALVQEREAFASLRTLNMSSTNIHAAGAAALCDFLCGPNALAVLQLDKVFLGIPGALALAEGVGSPDALITSLRLRSTSLADEGVCAICTALLQRKCIVHLDLAHCGITATGFEAVGQVVKTCPSLRTVDLTRNTGRDEGAELLCESARHSSGLTTISVTDNQIGDSGARAILKLVRINQRVRVLRYGGQHALFQNSISASFRRDIDEQIALNRLAWELQRAAGSGREDEASPARSFRSPPSLGPVGAQPPAPTVRTVRHTETGSAPYDLANIVAKLLQRGAVRRRVAPAIDVVDAGWREVDDILDALLSHHSTVECTEAQLVKALLDSSRFDIRLQPNLANSQARLVPVQ